MGHSSKVVTCCYCGSKAALVLRGKVQHELACGRCGAPLHDMKAFPVKQTEAKRETYNPGHAYGYEQYKPKKKDKKRKRKKSLSRRAFSELFDVVEDLFD